MSTPWSGPTIFGGLMLRFHRERYISLLFLLFWGAAIALGRLDFAQHKAGL